MLNNGKSVSQYTSYSLIFSPLRSVINRKVVSGIGYGKTKKQIKGMAESAALDKGVLRKERISDGWFCTSLA